MGAVIVIFISCARSSAASAWRNLLHFVWLPWARDLLHRSQMVCRSSGCIRPPLILTVRRRAVMQLLLGADQRRKGGPRKSHRLAG